MLTEIILLTIYADGKANEGMTNNLAERRKANAKCLRLSARIKPRQPRIAEESRITRQIKKIN